MPSTSGNDQKPDLQRAQRRRLIAGLTQKVAGIRARSPSAARADTMSIIDDEGLAGRAADLGRHAQERLWDLAGRHRGITEVRGAGLLLGVERVDAGGAPDPDRAIGIVGDALARTA